VITDWETNAILIADTLPRRFPALFEDFAAVLKARHVPYAIIKGTRDVWLRDFAPIQVTGSRFVQFRYRPDYLRGHPGLITTPRVFKRFLFLKNLQSSGLIIDGGNLVSNGSTVILTDKVFQENPDRTQNEIEHELRTALGQPRLIFIPQEPDDIIGHSDGMMQFVSRDRIVLNDYSQIDDGFGQRLKRLLRKHGFRVTTLPYSPPQTKRRGIDSAVGNYVNFVRVGNLLIIPTYGIPEDGEAVRRLNRLKPRLKVIPLNCRAIAQEGGALHCVTWNIQRDGPLCK
jgi:agmatine deiminase